MKKKKIVVEGRSIVTGFKRAVFLKKKGLTRASVAICAVLDVEISYSLCL